MKTKTILTAVLLLLFVLSASSQTSFNGTWKLNKEKTTVPDELYLSQIILNVDGEKLITKRTYSNLDYQEYPFDEVITLDGKECKTVIYDMPRVSKARKGPDGSIIIESKTTFYNDSGQAELVANETWKVADQGKSLVCEFTTQMMGQERKLVFYYTK